MRHAGPIAVVGVLLTFGVGSVAAALAWEAAGRGGHISTGWILGAYLAFLSASWTLLLIAVKRGAFRNPEAAKYPMLRIREEPECFRDDFKVNGINPSEKDSKDGRTVTAKRQQP